MDLQISDIITNSPEANDFSDLSTDSSSKNSSLSKIYYLNTNKKKYQIITTKQDEEFIEFSVFILGNPIKNFKNKFSFEKIKENKIFLPDENLEEIFNTLDELISSQKVEISENSCDNSIITLILNDIIRKKNIFCDFILNTDFINTSELIENLNFKTNQLIQKDKEKDQIIKSFREEIDNLKSSIKIFMEYFLLHKDDYNNLNDEIQKHKIYTQKKMLFLSENKTQENFNYLAINEEFSNQKIINKKLSVEIKNLLNFSDNLFKENQLLTTEIIKIKDDQNKKNESLYKSIEFSTISKILKHDEIFLLDEFFERDIKLELLYSSDKHGKEVKTFHEKCDGEKDTLTFYESEYGKRFGGFTKLPWASQYLYLKGDGSDFIFSLTHRKMFKNVKIHEYAIYNNPNFFPSFGGGHDIKIEENCFNDCYNTYSNFPSSYGSPDIGKEGKKFFGGSWNFKITKIEVFKVKFL